ncbi:protein HID1-like [Corticium candelabrum]|uniref:protein HID1-like n=1 Tax=Corticium candelabrum TaxID=121492 RepID=UPI002E2F8308|nr:protein HID1-like [Corticium candelabrum]
MGSSDSKQSFRNAVCQLTSKTTPIEATDDGFWKQLIWNDAIHTPNDIFTLVEPEDVRTMRDTCPSNLATICYKAVEHLVAVSSGLSAISTASDQRATLNSVRLLIRILPFVFEDPNWRNFFWSTISDKADQTNQDTGETSSPLAHSLLSAIANLLFSPDFTVLPSTKAGPDNPDDLTSFDSCEFIWEAGVGCSASPGSNAKLDNNRAELLKLLLTSFSEVIYLPPSDASPVNRWVSFFTSGENRHALPLLTSLVNVVFAYDPVGYGLPYYHAVVVDFRERLVEVAVQILIITLDNEGEASQPGTIEPGTTQPELQFQDNLFCHYVSRLYREEDFHFILYGFTTLLNNPLLQTYLPNSCKKIHFHQELLILFWKLCDINKKFLFYVLKSSNVLELLVPILYHLNLCRSDPAKTGLMHIGFFILLMLSGERNFGVRLNKPYQLKVPMDLPVFSGTHADLLFLVFHKVITTGHQKLQPLYECLLTIMVNVSPYLKTLSQVTSSKLLHLTEAFCTPWFMFANSTNHHLVFFLLEIFNNMIQYQFDGNAQLIYTVIRKRSIFHELANLSTDPQSAIKPRRLLQGDHPARETSNQSTAKQPVASSDDGQTPAATAVEVAQTVHPPTLAREGSTSSRAAAAESDSVPQDRWVATKEWIQSWKQKLPLQTILRLLQVLVPQVEKICIDKGLTDESEILKFLRHGTLVGLLPVPHPILIRKFQPNAGTTLWFRTYMWGLVYLRNIDPAIWYETEVKLFEIQKV